MNCPKCGTRVQVLERQRRDGLWTRNICRNEQCRWHGAKFEPAIAAIVNSARGGMVRLKPGTGVGKQWPTIHGCHGGDPKPDVAEKVLRAAIRERDITFTFDSLFRRTPAGKAPDPLVLPVSAETTTEWHINSLEVAKKAFQTIEQASGVGEIPSFQPRTIALPPADYDQLRETDEQFRQASDLDRLRAQEPSPDTPAERYSIHFPASDQNQAGWFNDRTGTGRYLDRLIMRYEQARHIACQVIERNGPRPGPILVREPDRGIDEATTRRTIEWWSVYAEDTRQGGAHWVSVRGFNLQPNEPIQWLSVRYDDRSRMLRGNADRATRALTSIGYLAYFIPEFEW